MSEEAPVRRPRSSDTFTPAINQALLEKLSEKALDRFFNIIEKMVDAGKTDLMQGYAAAIMGADFMHSAGLLSNSAYSAIFALENIMAGISAVDSVLGSITGTISPFTPSLKTLIQLGAESGSTEQVHGKTRTRTSFAGAKQPEEVVEEETNEE